MNDAAEVLLSVYEKVVEVAATLGRPAGIDATFGLEASGWGSPREAQGALGGHRAASACTAKLRRLVMQ